MNNNKFKSIVGYACTAFSAIILLFCLVIAIMGEKNYGIRPTHALALFVFCMIISALSVIMANVKLNAALKYVIHAFVTVLSSAIMLTKVNGLQARTVFVTEVVLLLVHAPIFILAVMHGKKKGHGEK